MCTELLQKFNSFDVMSSQKHLSNRHIISFILETKYLFSFLLFGSPYVRSKIFFAITNYNPKTTYFTCLDLSFFNLKKKCSTEKILHLSLSVEFIIFEIFIISGVGVQDSGMSTIFVKYLLTNFSLIT